MLGASSCFFLLGLFILESYPEILANSLPILFERISIGLPKLICEDGRIKANPRHPAKDKRYFFFHLEVCSDCNRGSEVPPSHTPEKGAAYYTEGRQLRAQGSAEAGVRGFEALAVRPNEIRQRLEIASAGPSYASLFRRSIARKGKERMVATNQEVVDQLTEISQLLRQILSELQDANSKLGWIESNTG